MSQTTHNVQDLLTAQKSLDLREEKLRAIKARIEAGDYSPDPECIAEGIIRTIPLG